MIFIRATGTVSRAISPARRPNADIPDIPDTPEPVNPC
jgi:hypothetical protein